MDRKIIDEKVVSFLPKAVEHREYITEAMNYSVTNGGKRIRPYLMYLAYRMCGGDKDIVDYFMAAIEMIHSFSLVHDDLPAMDNDVLRRGRPTTWSKYGEAQGILAGDGLSLYAFETCLSSAKEFPDCAERIVKASHILANKSGLFGMIGGQSLDVMMEGKKLDKDQINFIHENKTCALLEAPFMIGAVLAGKDENYFGELGLKLGLAFQIQDDYLDVAGDEETLGKPVNSDEKNNKMTYVNIFGLVETKMIYETYYRECIEIVEALEGVEEYKKEILEVIRKLISRNN